MSRRLYGCDPARTVKKGSTISNVYQENEDAELVNKAQEHIEAGCLETAFKILSEVANRTPERWVHKFVENDCLNIKFWDRTEFDHYILWTDRNGGLGYKSLYWIPNAYPRAWYYLGFIYLEHNNFSMARDCLEFGKKLEPTNPMFMNELAQVAIKMKDFDRAFAYLKDAPREGPHVTAKARAFTLRNMGMVLIEFEEYEHAENSLKLSLRYQPDNELALNELAYIDHLRKGGLKNKFESPTYKPSKSQT